LEPRRQREVFMNVHELFARLAGIGELSDSDQVKSKTFYTGRSHTASAPAPRGAWICMKHPSNTLGLLFPGGQAHGTCRSAGRNRW
jgi:hypothetical protein